jgi:hypothetical protein
MRRTILIVACLLLVVASAYSQRKRTTSKSKPRADPSDLFDPLPKDELLYDKAEYSDLKYRIGWRQVGFSNEDSERRQTKTYYDPRRIIVVSSTLKRVWVKFDTTKAGTLEKSFTSFVEYDCTGARARTLAVTVFDKEGRPIGDADAATPFAWKYIVPDTLTEAVYGVVCLHWKDKVEQDMDQAARWFMLARQAEKRREFKGAELLYERAKDFDPVNNKISAAIERVKKQ